jgi:hypothetical protein
MCPPQTANDLSHRRAGPPADLHYVALLWAYNTLDGQDVVVLVRTSAGSPHSLPRTVI